MLQADEPSDYVLATGHAMTVRDFCVAAFARVNLDWEKHVAYDARYERPSEVDALIVDASKAERVLGWKAETYGDDLVNKMVDGDVKKLEDELAGPASASTARPSQPRVGGDVLLEPGVRRPYAVLQPDLRLPALLRSGG